MSNSSLPNPKKINKSTVNLKRQATKAEKSAARVKASAPPPPPPKVPERKASLSRLTRESVSSRVNPAPNIGQHKRELSSMSIPSHMNPYYATLKYPARCVGVRIPNEGAIDTSTFSLVGRFALNVNSNGVGAMVLGRVGSAISGLIPQNIGVGTGASPTTPFAVGFLNHLAATDNALFSATVATGSPPLQWPGWTLLSDPIPTLFEEIRLVSMGLSAISTAAATANSGFYQIGSFPRNFLVDFDLSTFTTNSVATMPGVIQVPISEGKGVSATYTPTDPLSFQFTPPGNLVLSETSLQSCDGGGFIVTVSGAAANSTIIVTCILNFEAVPFSQSLSFFNTGMAPNDPIAIADAMNRREHDELVRIGTSGIDGLTPTVGESDHPLMKKFPALGGSLKGGHQVISSPTRVSRRARKETEEFKQVSMFDQVLNLILPIAKQVMPSLLSLI